MFGTSEMATAVRNLERARDAELDRMSCDEEEAEEREIVAYGKLIESDGDVQEALSESCYRDPAIAEAFRNGNAAELGRLLLRRGGEYLWDVAQKEAN